MTSMSTSSTTTIPSHGPPPKQPTYTTAGTVYNPTITPLQPPARRGRASRCAPPSQVDLASFNKSVLAGFQHKVYHSPPTTASTLKHYTPLQQNSDRAVEPPICSTIQGRSLSESSSTPSLNSAYAQSSMNGPNGNSRLLDDMRLTDGEKDEEELVRMSVLPVRTITNLASYPNPSQKLAQKALDRARETFKAAAEVSRSWTPNISGQAPSQSREGLGARANATKLDRGGGGISGWISKYDQGYSDIRSSVLSSGPGAPQPLTAGPPGQRQYRPSTLEATFRALQTDRQGPSSPTVDETHTDIKSFSINVDTLSTTTMSSQVQSPRQKFSQTKDYFGFCKPAVQPTANMVLRYDPNEPRRPTYDTLSVDEVRVYFPDGFPPDLGPPTVPTLPKNSGIPQARFPPTFEDLRLRDMRSKVAFYAATQDLTKTLDMRVAEAQGKLQDLELGISSSRERTAARSAEFDDMSNLHELGKPKHEFSIDFANELPTHEAAIPLINMAFSTLLNYWADGRLMTIPTGFEKDPRYQGLSSQRGRVCH